MSLTDSPTEGLLQVPVERSGGSREPDWVTVEEPLEIRVDGRPLAVTMRTPGEDRELAAGFLFTEGVIQSCQDLESIEPCANSQDPEAGNLIFVHLRPEAAGDPKRLQAAKREFRASSACGLCGKTSLEDVWQRIPPIEPLECPRELLAGLPQVMRQTQALFHRTGGIHAAALFDAAGNLLCVHEDIGRHNAVDKLVGRFVLEGDLPLRRRILVTSGRAGFEVVQKAMMAAIPVLVAVGAASSLAVELAHRGGLALYSFMSPGRGNRHLPEGSDVTEPTEG